MTDHATIWHYPRCSKSRKTLALLEAADLTVEIRPYQQDPPDAEQLAIVIERLGISPRELVRRGDKFFKELAIDADSLDDQGWIDLMVEHPRLIERPVVLTDKGAVIGRPPERIKEIL